MYVQGSYMPEDIIHSHRVENLKSYIALAGRDLKGRRNVSTVRYVQGFCIPEGVILPSHRHENLRSYIALPGWAL
jgi:hypothetical protein